MDSTALSAAQVEAVRVGYAGDFPGLEIGALANGDVLPDVPIRIPLAMLTRHGLVAGATGTGKTKTLQMLAEQLSAAGVPVFAADIKGDLAGIAVAGEPSDKLLARTRGIRQYWMPAATPTEYFTLGGLGTGVPIRATVDGFGPLLLSKVLGLNATQESSLGLVFHYAKGAGLPLVDLGDLRSVLTFLISSEGKGELSHLGGLSKATAGVILRELITFADRGADAFFGAPAIDPADFLRVTADGRGVVNLLELPGVQDQSPSCSRPSSCGCSPTCIARCPKSETSRPRSSCSSSTRRTCCSGMPRRTFSRSSRRPSGSSARRGSASSS